MPKKLDLTDSLEKYIVDHSENLTKVQKEIIDYNLSLGDQQRLQISILQANFLQFLIKVNKFKSCLEVGMFTGYSSLSMALSLPKNGKICTIDKNVKTNKIAINFFKQANVHSKFSIEPNVFLFPLFRLGFCHVPYPLVQVHFQ